MPLIYGLFSRPALTLLTLAAAATACLAQPPQPPTGQSPVQHRIATLLEVPNGAWTDQQITTMGRLRDAALTDPYAITELQHLSDNIGPRLSGSPQAQAAVEYVAAEMRAIGADVQLEKT